MMYKVLLVDDEEIILEGTRQSVPWETFGMELVGTAENGREAVRQAKRLDVDIVITDIRMPRMDGVELIRALREQRPMCRFIILTGFGEFEYARVALQMGVYDYLLKPVDLNALCGVLTRLRQELDTQHSQQSRFDLLQQRIQEEGMVREQFLLRRYLAGTASPEELKNGLSKKWLDAVWCAGVLVQIDDFDRLTADMNEENIFTFTQELEGILVAQSDEDMRVIENDHGRYFLLFINTQEHELRFRIRSYIRRLRAAAMRMAYTTICSSTLQGGITQCRQAYEETQQCIDQTFLLGEGQDIQASEVLAQDFTSPLPKDVDMRNIIQALSGFRKEEVHQALKETEKAIRRDSHNSYLYTSMLVGFVFGEIIRLLGEMHCPIQSILPEPMADYRKLMACQSLDCMMQELTRILDIICDFVKSNEGGNPDIVDRAKVYIGENYLNSGLSLDIVAGAVNISPTYLSALFKQNTGQSFVSYLTEMRLEHAQNLLRRGDYRSYEVAYMCGYDNSTYFSTIFKRYVGVSPSEYRREWERRHRKDTH
ncbi:DNA-binding response regulator [Clostridiaceae bacterium]|nr:DNA-binding response regulator [Clostridiaceae bacterium]